MATHFTKGKKKATKDINSFLQYIATKDSRTEIPRAAPEIEKEFRYITSKLVAFENIKTYIQYIDENELCHNRDVLKNFVAESNMDDIETEEEDDAFADYRPVRGKYKEKRDEREFSDSEDEDVMSSAEESAGESDSDAEPDKPVARPCAPKVSDNELQRMERERALNNLDVQQEEKIKSLRRENTINMSEDDFQALINKTIERCNEARRKIMKTATIPESLLEENLRHISTRRRLTQKEKSELDALEKSRLTFERIAANAVEPPQAAKVYNNLEKSRMKVYRDAEWMRVGNKGVKNIYVNLQKHGLATTIKHGGNTWFLASNGFFYLLSVANTMRQHGNTLWISSTLNGGKAVEVKMLYQYSDDTFLEHGENTFNLMEQFMKARKANPKVQEAMKTEEIFTLDNTDARKMGNVRLAFPGGDEQEVIIAKMSVGKTIAEYFRNIANISVYLHTGIHSQLSDIASASVFKQRLDMKWFPIGDLNRLEVFDKIDYEELAEYYLGMIEYEVSLLRSEYFSMSGKYVKFEAPQPRRPVIENENLNGSRINYDGQLYNLVGLDAGRMDERFRQKIAKIAAFSAPARVYTKTIWDIVDNALDYARKHYGSIEHWIPKDFQYKA